jgi:hypothetical protein
MPCREIVRQVDESLDFLSVRLDNLPTRHRSLRALFAGSWRLLSALEQAVLMRLSVFTGGWSVDEAALVAGATPSLLLGLVDKSLVRADGQRFDLHELVRQYAAEQLAINGETTRMRQRHYDAYLQLFRTGDWHLRRVGMETWLARLDVERDNLRSALQWALDEARYEEAAWLMVAVHYFWYLNGSRYEGAKWLAQLLPHRHTLPPALRLAILICFYASGRELDEAQPFARYQAEYFELLDHCGDHALQSAAWYFVAWSATELAQGMAAVEQAILLGRLAYASPRLSNEFSAMADMQFTLPTMLQIHAELLLGQGEMQLATTHSQEALRLFRALGDQTGITDALGNLGRLALVQGDLEQAHTLLQEVMALATPFSQRLIACKWQPLLAIILLYRGDAKTAHRLLHQSLQTCLEFKNKQCLTQVYAYLAEIALWEGEIDEAERWLAQSLSYQATTLSTPLRQTEWLWLVARLATARRQYERAALLFGQAAQAHGHLRERYAGPMLALNDRALVMVRSALSPEEFDKAFAAGKQLTIDDLLANLANG